MTFHTLTYARLDHRMIHGLPRSPLSAAWAWGVGAAILLGAYVRLDQILVQVLIDDEWHAIHQLLKRTPGSMFFDFGYADYSIPLGMLYWYEAQSFGLSEFAMRLPMLVGGLATLVVFPLYVASRLGRATSVVFAILIAISPLLVLYTRIARPYAITLLLAWVAHSAYQRYHDAVRGHWSAGLLYGASATLAVWLHPVIAPFIIAPLLWALLQLRHAVPGARRRRLYRLALLALSTGIAMGALVLPPLLAHPEALVGKGGINMPDLATLAGAWYAWLGTPSTFVVLLCVGLAAYGARDVWRALPEARTGVLGVALSLAAVMLTRPMWSQYPTTLARYLLPFIPLLLLAVAAGSVKLGRRLAAPTSMVKRSIGALVALVPCVALAAQSPLAPSLRHPNAQTLHSVFYVDFRPEKNPYLPYIEGIPLSPFWASLAERPPGTVRIAAAPFYFESYNWDAPRWERVARQTVLPGYLTGLCVEERAGEVPRDARFRFRNAVHLADDAALDRKHVDYIVWQKPYTQSSRGRPEPIGAETAHCEAALRAKFGTPVFEDAALLAFRR